MTSLSQSLPRRTEQGTSFALRSVLPRIARFTDRHPALRVEFILNDEKQDLVGDAVDVALRIGSLGDSTAVARKIGVVHRVLAASPTYLARAGTPRAPAELTGYSIIVGPAGRLCHRERA
jgi:DNA-binding transcriptional LysR family regulator